jgi:hypothetical protein
MAEDPFLDYILKNRAGAFTEEEGRAAEIEIRNFFQRIGLVLKGDPSPKMKRGVMRNVNSPEKAIACEEDPPSDL